MVAGLSVDVSELSADGGELGRVADGVDGLAGRVPAPSAGPRVRSAGQALRARLTAGLESYAAHVADLGDRAEASAASYVDVDDLVAERLRSVMSSGPVGAP